MCVVAERFTEMSKISLYDSSDNEGSLFDDDFPVGADFSTEERASTESSFSSDKESGEYLESPDMDDLSHLQSEALIATADKLKNPQKIYSLNLTGCALDLLTVEQIKGLFSQLGGNLQELNLSQSGLGYQIKINDEKRIDKYQAIFSNLKSLRKLDLSFNGIGVLELNELGEIFSHLGCLRSLNLSGNVFDNLEKIESYEAIFKPLVSLRSLDLCDNNFDQFSLKMFRAFCKTFPDSLEDVVFSNEIVKKLELINVIIGMYSSWVKPVCVEISSDKEYEELEDEQFLQLTRRMQKLITETQVNTQLIQEDKSLRATYDEPYKSNIALTQAITNSSEINPELTQQKFNEGDNKSNEKVVVQSTGEPIAFGYNNSRALEENEFPILASSEDTNVPSPKPNSKLSPEPS